MSDRLIPSFISRRRSVQLLRRTDHYDSPSSLPRTLLPPQPPSSSREPRPSSDTRKRFARLISCLRFINTRRKRASTSSSIRDATDTPNGSSAIGNNDDAAARLDETLSTPPSPPATPQQQICNRNELQMKHNSEPAVCSALSPPPRHHRTLRERPIYSMIDDRPTRYDDNEIAPHNGTVRRRLPLHRATSTTGHLRLSIDVDQHYTSSILTDGTTITTYSTDDGTVAAPSQQRTGPFFAVEPSASTQLSSIITESDTSMAASEPLFPSPSSHRQYDELCSAATTVVDEDKAHYEAVVADTVGRNRNRRNQYCQRPAWIATS